MLHCIINDDQLVKKLETVSTQWSPPTPIKILFTQLKTCQNVAYKDNDPINDADTMRTGVQVIKVNGHFDIACCEWRAKKMPPELYPSSKAMFALQRRSTIAW